MLQSRATPLMENFKPAKSLPCTGAKLDALQPIFHRNFQRKKCVMVLTRIFHMKILLMKNKAFLIIAQQRQYNRIEILN